MNPALFRKLVEKKLIAANTNVAVEYKVFEDQKKVKTVKGMYKIARMYAHPLMFGTIIEVTNDTETVNIEAADIKLIEGLTPVKLAAQHGIRPDGKDNDAPKRRGRKPKVRVVEPEFTEDDFSDEDEDEEELMEEAE